MGSIVELRIDLSDVDDTKCRAPLTLRSASESTFRNSRVVPSRWKEAEAIEGAPRPLLSLRGVEPLEGFSQECGQSCYRRAQRADR